MSVESSDSQDRREVDRVFRRAKEQKLVGYRTTRAFGYPPDEAGTITLEFEDGLTIELSPTGYEADGISVTAKN